MQEVEVKARVTDEARLLSQLDVAGIKLGPGVRQEDVIYSTKTWDFTEFNNTENTLRIRRQSGRTLFTLKRGGTNELDGIECEVEVNDAKQLAEIIRHLGYFEEVRVNKTRRKAKLGDIEICLDEVEGLGTFIELEKLTQDANTTPIQEELFRLLESWSVKRTDRETHGYDTLIALQQRQAGTRQ